MTKKVKRLISAIVSFALMLTVLTTPLGDVVGVTKDSVGTTASAAKEVYFSNYSSSISNGDSKINEALGLINNQGGNTSISGKSKTDLVKYFLYESKYSVYNGQGLPYEYSNQYFNDTGKFCGTFSDVNGSIGYSRYVGASGCRAYAWFVRAVFYDTTGTSDTICETGKATSAAIKSYVIKNSQAGESLSYGSAHANVFVAASDLGIFVLNYGGATNEKPTFRYITYDNMAKYANDKGVGIYTRNQNTAINQINLSSTPTDIGSSFTSTIKCTSTGKFLTVDSNNNVVALSCDNSNKQKWKFTKNSDNYYEIENVATGLRLDVDNAGDEKGTNIQGYKDNDSPAQRWGIYGSQGSYVLKPKYSSTLVLDSDGGNNNVHLWTYYSNVAAQKFTIIPDPAVKFDTYSITNITSTAALVKCKAYKPASAKAVKYGICYAPSSIWGIVLGRKYFYSTASISNVGNTSRSISFDFDIEMNVKLTPNTEYKYYFIAVYDFGDGETRTYTSDTKSFVTKTSSNQTHTHSYSSTVTTSATCTSAGVRTYKCSCGSSYTESISALGHNYGSWTTATSATCTSGGTEKRTCSRCGNSETRSTSALGHSYGSTFYEAAHPHYYAHKCTRCGYGEKTGGNKDYYHMCSTCTHLTKPVITSITNPIIEGKSVTVTWEASDSDKLSNYWVNIFADGENIAGVATGTKNSYTFTAPYTTNKCIVINIGAIPLESQSGEGGIWCTDNVYGVGCNHTYISTVVKPTLDAEGYTLHKCSVCGDSYKDNFTAKLLPPTQVTGLAYDARNEDQITLKWNKSDNTDGYIVEYLSGDRFVKLADKTSGSTVSHIATGLEPGTLYKFRIRAYRNVNGARAYAAYSDVLCVRTLPAAMSGFALGARTDTTITLKWNKNESANGYVIEKYNGTKWVTLVTKTSNTAVSHKVTGLVPSTVYKFRVRSYIKDEEGRIYGEYTSTLSACTNPSVIEGLTLGGRAASALRLNWTENTSADGYIIERYNGTSWMRIAKITNNATTTYRVTGLSAGTAYKFRMRAYKMSGSTALYSGYTSTLSACTNPSNVIGVEIGGVASTALRVNWSQNTSADGYIVEIYKSGKWVRAAKITKNTTVTYRIGGLAKNTTYKIRIKAYKMSGTTALYSGYTTISGKTNT